VKISQETLQKAIVDDYRQNHPAREEDEITAEELAAQIGESAKVAENWLSRQVTIGKYTKRKVFMDGRFHSAYRKKAANA
jgi:hypothetical protein